MRKAVTDFLFVRWQLFGLLTLLSLVIGMTIPNRAEAQVTAACIDSNIATAIESELQLNLVGQKSAERCDAQTHNYRLLEALSIMKTVSFSDSHLPAPLNQDLLPNDFWNYFTTRISIIEDMPNTDVNCVQNVFAYVILNSGDRTVHICPVFYDDRATVYNRVQTLMHEARHVDGFAHVKCTRGANKGLELGCDQSIAQKGSYAVSVEALTKLALLDKRVSPADKEMNKLLAVVYADNSFNEKVLADSHYAVYLAGDDGHSGFIFDGEQLYAAPKSLTNATVVGLGDKLDVFPKDKSDAFVLDSFSMQRLTSLDSATEFYNEQDRQFVPITAVSQSFAAVILPNQVSGASANEHEFTNASLTFTPKSLFLPDELGVQSADSVFVVNDQAKMFQIQYLTGQKFQVTEVANSAAGFLSLVVFNQQRLGLTSQGAVFNLTQGQWVENAALKGRRFTSISRPFHWSSYFSQL